MKSQKAKNTTVIARSAAVSSAFTKRPALRPPFQRVKKVFLTRCPSFLNFEKVQKTLFIERAGGFLPPAHIPRYSVAAVCIIVF